MRIGINVPNELLERLKPLKKTSNVSQICRDAIKERVEAYERAMARANEDGMQAVVEQEIDWETLGQEDAKLWMQLASLQDFDQLFHGLDVLRRQKRSPGSWIAPDLPGAKTFHSRVHENQEWFLRQCELDENTNHVQRAESAYDLGWGSYMTAVWQMLRDRIAEDTKAREAALKQTCVDIELPDHLMCAEQSM